MTPFLPRRRKVLLGGLALAGAGGAPGRSAAQGQDPLSGDALFRDVVRYAGFGDHRTGVEADHQTSRWLARGLEAEGFKTRLSPWRHQQFFVGDQGLRVSGRAYETFPLWWPELTGPTPATGPLRRADRPDLKGAIAFTSLPRVPGTSSRPGGEVGCRIVEAAGRGAAGLVVVTQDPTGEIVALNAMSGLGRWPIPVLLVGQKDEHALAAEAERQAPAELRLDGRYDYAATAYEVVGVLERGPEIVVVSTPSSGWFTCAGERGPGIAMWLGLARWAARQSTSHSFVFVASSGHEMESVGIRHFVAAEAPPADRVRTWLHLGAGIATYAYDFGPAGPRRRPEASRARRLMTNDASLAPMLERRFSGLAGLRPIVSATPGGEMLLMARQGYKVWGFAGGSAFHHMRIDTPERITGPEILEPVARATAAALTDVL